MDCREAFLRLGAWVDGEVVPDVADHASSCSSCGEEAARLRELKREVARWRVRAPEDLRRALENRFSLRSASPRRWLAAAAAAGLVVAALILTLPPESQGLPGIVVNSSRFYDDLVAGRIETERCSTPAELREYLLQKVGTAVDAPQLPGSDLTAACPCCVETKISPWIVYRNGEDLLSLLVFEGRLPAMPSSALRTIEEKSFHLFRCGRNTVVVCPTGPTAHLWISRMPEDRMLATILATAEGRRVVSGIHLTVREVT